MAAFYEYGEASVLRPSHSIITTDDPVTEWYRCELCMARTLIAKDERHKLFWSKMFVRSWAIAAGKPVPPAHEGGVPWCVPMEEE